MSAAKIIPFAKPQPTTQEAKSMYSDRFKNGYVMSSRLYREEVRPFLTDAARNVYVELEDRIHGHQKDSDFISWTQLQGVGHPGARKSSLSTIRVGLAMLLANEVVSIVDSGKQGVKKYQINEVSLVGKKIIKPTEKEAAKYFGNRSTTETEALQKPKQTTTETEVDNYGNRSETTTETEDTIDIKIPLDSLREDEDNAQEPQKFSAQNRPLNFVEYHSDDRTPISFRDLCKKYPAQLDFQQQAKTNFPNHSPELIFETLKKMAQWSLDKSNHTPQKWMSIWLSTFMKNEKTDAEVAAAAERKAARAAKAQDKPQVRSRFGQYLKPQQEIRDV